MGESLATVRGAIYEGLAFAFSSPRKKFYRSLESKLLRPLKSLRSAFAWPSLKEAVALSDLVEKNQHDLGSELASIKADYHRLFVGPYRLCAPPYASLYLESEPTVMGQSTLEVLTLYQEAGFVVSPSFRDLPDHILAELEFMILLCESEQKGRQREDISQIALVIAREATFLRNHLSRWISPFASRILAATEISFYRALALLAQDFVLVDHDYVLAMNGILAGRRLPREVERDGA